MESSDSSVVNPLRIVIFFTSLSFSLKDKRSSLYGKRILKYLLSHLLRHIRHAMIRYFCPVV